MGLKATLTAIAITLLLVLILCLSPLVFAWAWLSDLLVTVRHPEKSKADYQNELYRSGYRGEHGEI